MLTTKQIAEKLGVTAYVVRKLVKNGQIPVIRLSETDFRFDETAVMEAIKNGNNVSR